MLSKEVRDANTFRRGARRLCLLAFTLFALAVTAAAQGVEVGRTEDACDDSRAVKFHGKSGQISVRAGHSARVELPSETDEITWFCGGTRERSANDKHFNVVRISRAPNGSIRWVFFKVPSPAFTNLVRVGDTKDACDGSNLVTFRARGDDEVRVRAGESRLVELGEPRNRLNWRCVPEKGCPDGSSCGEASANPVAFDTVQIARAGNGAISWVFFMRKNSGAAVPDFVRHASGDIRVGVSAGPLGQGEVALPPGFLRNVLMRLWDASRDEIHSAVRAEILRQGIEAARTMPGGGFRLHSLNIAASNSTELRTAAEGDTVSLKFLAHNNGGRAGFSLSNSPDPEFTFTFDLQAEVTLKLESPLKPPRALTAVLRLGHTEIEGSNFLGDIAQELFKSRLRDAKTRANNFLEDLTARLNEEIEEHYPRPPKQIPPNVARADISVTRGGTIRFCFRSIGAPGCKFNGQAETAHNFRVLDTSVDRCSRGRIWLLDAEKQRFVNVAKGQKNVLVEVNSREFPWFCGGEAGPETRESAAGPVGTYLVRVSRSQVGDRIDWEFLSWR